MINVFICNKALGFKLRKKEKIIFLVDPRKVHISVEPSRHSVINTA